MTTPRAAGLAPIGIGLATTALVTLLSYTLPVAYQATGVGLAFLGVTYELVLRRDERPTAHYGLALGGLFEPAPLSAARLLRDAAIALSWALGCAAIVFPLFWLGWL